MSLLWLWVAHAQAQADTGSHRRVTITFTSCEVPSPSEVRALLAIELREDLLPDGTGELETGGAAREQRADYHVQVQCSGHEAQVTVRETAATRTIALAKEPVELRARLLALAIAEQVSPASEPVPTKAQTATTEPAIVQPDPQAVAPLPRSTPRASAAEHFAWAALQLQASPLLGPGVTLGLSQRIWRLLSWSSSLSYSFARSSLDDGELRVQQTSVNTGPALHLAFSDLVLELGAGMRAGWLGLRGEPDDAARVRGKRVDTWLAGPSLFGALFVNAGKRGFGMLALELAYTLRKVHADVQGGGGRTLSALWGAASLGGGFAW
ncbi:MAG: hypothetical protein QM778_34880 [Myxococcales bacterium]